MSARRLTPTERQAELLLGSYRRREAAREAAEAAELRKADREQADVQKTGLLPHREGASSASILQAAWLRGLDVDATDEDGDDR